MTSFITPQNHNHIELTETQIYTLKFDIFFLRKKFLKKNLSYSYWCVIYIKVHVNKNSKIYSISFFVISHASSTLTFIFSGNLQEDEIIIIWLIRSRHHALIQRKKNKRKQENKNLKIVASQVFYSIVK